MDTNTECVRVIAQLAEQLSDTQRAVLLAYGEGMAAASELLRGKGAAS